MDTGLNMSSLVSLASLRTGQTIIVRMIMRGCGAQNRLLSLGLRKGARVEVVRSSKMNGPLIVKVNECQVAIGRCLAEAVQGDLVTE